MKKITAKLRSRRGESFVEILIAILIVAFGCMLIATMYTSAMNINIQTTKRDESYYDALSKMEQILEGEKTGSGRVVIKDENGSVSTSVDVYKDGDNTAYKR